MEDKSGAPPKECCTLTAGKKMKIGAQVTQFNVTCQLKARLFWKNLCM